MKIIRIFQILIINITKINTDIENNDNYIKSNYDVCIANENSFSKY